MLAGQQQGSATGVFDSSSLDDPRLSLDLENPQNDIDIEMGSSGERDESDGVGEHPFECQTTIFSLPDTSRETDASNQTNSETLQRQQALRG